MTRSKLEFNINDNALAAIEKMNDAPTPKKNKIADSPDHAMENLSVYTSPASNHIVAEDIILVDVKTIIIKNNICSKAGTSLSMQDVSILNTFDEQTIEKAIDLITEDPTKKKGILNKIHTKRKAEKQEKNKKMSP
jgi:hypothetical protein